MRLVTNGGIHQCATGCNSLRIGHSCRSYQQDAFRAYGAAVFGRPFVKRFALCYRAVVCPVLYVCLSMTFVYCGQWMDQDETWQAGRPRPRPHCVRWGPSSPKGHSPQFSVHVRCGQTAAWIKTPLGTEVGLGPGDIVLDWDPAASPSQKGGTAPNFRPMSVVVKRLDGLMD